MGLSFYKGGASFQKTKNSLKLAIFWLLYMRYFGQNTRAAIRVFSSDPGGRAAQASTGFLEGCLDRGSGPRSARFFS